MAAIRACFNPRTREGANTETFKRVLSTDSFNPRTREGANYQHKLIILHE